MRKGRFTEEQIIKVLKETATSKRYQRRSRGNSLTCSARTDAAMKNICRGC
jgi:hypothetical protein